MLGPEVCTGPWRGCIPGDSARELSASGAVEGSLDDGDRTVSSDGTPYDLWVFAGKRREEIIITMESSAVDAYLIIAHAGAALADDDDSGGGTNARIRLTLPADGYYLIVANAIGRKSRGAYRIRVVSEP
jgi:hypothetical protein